MFENPREVIALAAGNMPGRANMANGSGGLACLPPKHVFPFPTGLKRASLSAMTYLGTSPPVAGCTARRTCRQRYGERRAMAGSFRTIYLLPHRSPISNSASFAFAIILHGVLLPNTGCVVRPRTHGQRYGNAEPWLEVSNHIPSAASQPHIQLRQLRFCDGPRRTLPPVTGCVSRRTRNQRHGKCRTMAGSFRTYTFCSPTAPYPTPPALSSRREEV